MNLKNSHKRKRFFLIAEIGGNHGGNLQYAKKTGPISKRTRR